MKRLLLMFAFGMTASSLWAWRTLEGDHAKCYQGNALVYEGPGKVWPISDTACNVLASTAGYHCTSCVAYSGEPKKEEQ